MDELLLVEQYHEFVHDVDAQLVDGARFGGLLEHFPVRRINDQSTLWITLLALHCFFQVRFDSLKLSSRKPEALTVHLEEALVEQEPLSCLRLAALVNVEVEVVNSSE